MEAKRGIDKIYVGEKYNPVGYIGYVYVDTNVINAYTTHVDEDMAGQGIGKTLVEGLADFAREHSLQVVPGCPFIRSVMENNPEYRGLIYEEN